MNTDKDLKEIPVFLQESAETVHEDDALSFVDGLPRLLIGVSLFWLLCLIGYIQFFFGWMSFSALLPGEFVLFLSGAIVPLAVILLLVCLIYNQLRKNKSARMMEASLNRLLFNQDKNPLAEAVSRPLQNQVTELTAAARHMAQQTDLLKQTLESKAEDFNKIGQAIETLFAANREKLDTSINNLTQTYQKAADEAGKSASLFEQQVENLENKAQKLSDQLNPLINETVATADHLKNIISDNQSQISKANTDLTAFADSSRNSLQDMLRLLNEHNSKLEKNFLQTADNCEEIYKRLDSGISHIENSLQTHKTLAAEQSALLDKNATWLDGKLGEYGRLISLEVEAMVKRSSTLDMNVKKQVAVLNEAREKIDQVLNEADSRLTQKSDKAARQISKIVAGLDSELDKISHFMQKTENKNQEVQSTAEKITSQIGKISQDLGQKVDDLKLRSVEAIDKFNEVSGIVQKNAALLTETSNVIVAKGHEGADLLAQQKKHMADAAADFELLKKQISLLDEKLSAVSSNTETVFENYKNQITAFENQINRQLHELDESKIRSEKHLAEVKTQYETFSMRNFMNESAALIESLENMAVDLNHFFNDAGEDDLWKKFYNGDHAVFARNVVKNLDRKQIVRIRNEYESNADFRTLADRYIHEFEILLNAAGQSEKPEVILSMLSGADVGKIYYITARALGRLD